MPLIPQLTSVSVTPGTTIDLTFSGQPEGTHVEVQIQRVAVLNRQFAMSTVGPIAPDRVATVSVQTNSMQPGYYELNLARSVTNVPTETPAEPKVHELWHARTLQERVIFEIAQTPRTLTPAAVVQEVAAIEAQLEHDFLQPVQAVAGLAQPATRHFTAFVFVRGMLISSQMRFPHFEIVPTAAGVESTDKLNAVNKFLRERTTTGVQFGYSKERSQQSLQANPLCVFHFPAVRAPSPQEVRSYAVEITEKVLLAMALTRDASGHVFDCVVFENTGQAFSFAESPSYVGNLLTGWLSGESPETIERFATQIGRSRADRLLVRLYKDARSEPSPDFQYVRYWAVLEALADAREYDSDAPLLDFEGNQMRADAGRLMTINSSVNSVFNLMRESSIGSTERNWRMINTWFALRTAAAHYGALTNFRQLKRPIVRTFAQNAFDAIRTASHDQYLWELKEDTKLLLMRRLNRTEPWH